jgi:hypothetical protein
MHPPGLPPYVFNWLKEDEALALSLKSLLLIVRSAALFHSLLSKPDSNCIVLFLRNFAQMEAKKMALEKLTALAAAPLEA